MVVPTQITIYSGFVGMPIGHPQSVKKTSDSIVNQRAHNVRPYNTKIKKSPITSSFYL